MATERKATTDVPVPPIDWSVVVTGDMVAEAMRALDLQVRSLSRMCGLIPTTVLRILNNPTRPVSRVLTLRPILLSFAASGVRFRDDGIEIIGEWKDRPAWTLPKQNKHHPAVRRTLQERTEERAQKKLSGMMPPDASAARHWTVESRAVRRAAAFERTFERNKDVLARYDAGETLTAIGKVCGISREMVRLIARDGGRVSKRDQSKIRNSLPRAPKPPRPPVIKFAERNAEIFARNNAGESRKSIAMLYGISAFRVGRIVKIGGAPSTIGRRVMSGPQREERDQDIVDRHNRRESTASIAIAHGLSDLTVSRIVKKASSRDSHK